MKLPALVLVLAACASASRAPAKSRRPAAGGRVLRSRDEALLAQSEASRTELEARARLAAARANRQRGTDFRDPCSGLAMTQEDWEPFINERSPDPFPKPYNVQPMHYATGYFHIGCIVDSQRDQTRWYHDNVPKLDRLGMTPAECFGFCRNVSGALFFGLKGGDKCYCTPFSHNTDKGGRGMCDVPCTGDSSMTCGGKEMIDMYEMHDCNNLPELKCTRQPPPVKHAQMFKSIYYRPASICANAMSEAVTDRKPHCDVQCESGYELLKNTIQCVEKGNRLTYSWAEFEGSAACTPVVCGVPPEGVLSSRSPMPRHYPQKTLYGCFFGHSTMPHLPNASGPKNFTIKCQANATFSPIRECSRVHCGACPSRPHAEAREAGLRVYEDSCTYDCHSGYTIDQNAAGLTVWRGKCHANGQFTTMHQCKPVKCPGQRQVEHAEIVYDDTGAQQNIVFPMMVHYRCQEGYTRNGVVGAENAFTRECQADGILSLPDPECIRDGTTCAQCLPVSCGDPAEVANASYSPQARVYKEKLIYSCNRGYSLDGQAGGPSVTVLTCQSDGTYDAPPPVCVPVECGASPAHPNAEVQGSPGAMIHFESQPLLFKCLPGFSTEVGDDPYRVQKDSYSISCTSSGQFSAYTPCVNINNCLFHSCGRNGDCEDLPAPTGTPLDDYRCKCWPGYETTLSTAGNFTEKICTNIDDCPRPEPPDEQPCGGLTEEGESRGECVDHILGYTCTCYNGYELHNATPTNETCMPVVCGPVPKPNFTTHDFALAEADYDSPAWNYTCDEGYSLSGAYGGPLVFSMGCNSGGKFDPQPGVCLPVTCGAAPVLDFCDSTEQALEMVFPETASYRCNEGYSLTAKYSRADADISFWIECLSDGNFSIRGSRYGASRPALCLPVECGIPTLVANAYHADDTEMFVYPQTARQICAEGHSLDNSTALAMQQFEVQCLSDGTFSDPPEPGQCVPVACPALVPKPNMTCDTTAKVYQQEAECTADAGFTLDGTASGRTSFKCLCQANATFTPVQPVLPVSCGPAPNYTDKFASGPQISFVYSQVASYSCFTGYSLDGTAGGLKTFQIGCQANGAFDEHAGCQPINCGAWELLPHTHQIPDWSGEEHSSLVYGQVAALQCSPGWSTDGALASTNTNGTIACQADGTLLYPKICHSNNNDCGGSDNQCLPSGTCHDHRQPTGIHFDDFSCLCSSGFAENTSAQRKTCYNIPDCPAAACQPGFCTDLVNDYSCTCPRGYYEGPNTEEDLRHDCLPVSCGVPRRIAYSSVSSGAEQFFGGPDLLYTCEPGYTTDGRADGPTTFGSICLSNGTGPERGTQSWTPSCLPVECGTAPVVGNSTHGFAADHVFKYPEELKYTCDTYYQLASASATASPAPPQVTTWILSGGGESCDEACSASGSSCDASADWPTTEAAVSIVGSLLGHSCDQSTNYGGDWEFAPYTYTPDGRCNYPTSATYPTCSAAGADANIRRFCPCTPTVQAGALPQFGDAVTYTCGEGYRAVLGAREEPAIGGARSFTLSCDGLGSIGPSDWRCAAISCPIPAVEGGQVEIPDPSYTGSLLFGSSLPMHCDAGYSLDGHPSGLTSFTETCQDDGTFSADIECIAIDWCETDQCGQFGECVNGQLSYTCSCHEGYESVPVADGSHSTCAEIDECDTMAGHTACDAGQNLGSCVDGHLGYSCMCGRGAKNISGADGRPGCAAMSCETVPARMFQSCAMQGIKISYAQSTQYACDPGYSLDAQPLGPSSYTVSCNLTADEANVELRGFQDCLPVFCGSLPEVEHANSSLANLSYGQSATYTCEQGFSTGGDADSPKEFTVSCTACGSLSSLGECKIISCGHLPSVSFSTATEAELFYKDVGKYECDEGHTISGQPPHVSPSYFEAACQADGTFYGIKNCQPVTCGVPTPANHSLNTPTAEVLYGEEFEVTCESGYTVDADHMGSNHFIVGCNAEGDFTNELKCLPVSCGVPQETDTEISSDPEKFYGELAHWECKDGYSTSGLPFGLRGAPPLTTLSRQCGPSGLFGIASPGECVDIDYCSTNPCTHNGVCTDLGEGLHSPGYECECGEGYEAATDAAGGPTCTEDDCAGDPCGAGTCTDLSKQGGDDGTYSCTCDFGYELTEPVVGRPTCTHLVCGTLAVDSPSNVMMDLIKGIPQVSVSTWLSDATELDMYTQTPILKAFDVATYTCQHGYSADGSNNPDAATISITCNELGIWSRSMDHTFKCVRKMCDNLATGSLAHSELINEKVPWLYGDVAEFRCDTGHTITGEVGAAATFQIECGADGFSSSRVQGCQPVGCLVPTHPLASPTHTGTILYGQAITYTCDSGAGVQGSSSLTSYSGQCEADGTIWAGTDRCQLVSCGVATVPNNAALKVVSATYAEKGSGECDTEMVLYSGRAADQVECEVRCSQSALCAFYTYSSTWPNCILASECDSLAGSTGQTWTKQPQEFYTLDAGSCCCPADERIGTEEECAEAVAAIGFSGLGAELNTTHNPLYPGGCSYHAKTLVGHFNSQLTGIGAMDQVQVCKRPVCADAHLSMGDASIDGDLANLGNYRGSESLAAEIRYTNVGQFLGTNLDVVLTTPTWAMPAREDPDEPPFYKYVFGRLPAAHGLEYEITFEFQDHITHEPVVLSEFDVTFFDLDGDDYGMETLKTSGYTEIFQFQNSEVQLTEMRDGSLLAEGTVKNAGDGTPVADDSLTEKQAQKSIAFRYKDTSSFKITMGMTGGTGAASEWCRYFIWTFESAMVTRPPCAEYTPPPAPLVPVPAGYSSTFGSAPLRVVCDEGTFVGGEVGGATYYTMSCGSDGNFFASSQQVCEEILYSVAGQGTDAQDEDVKLAGAVLKWSRDGAVVATTTVDQSGEYSALLGPGTYTVVAELDGYITMTKEVAVLGEISVGSIGDFALSKILALGEWRVVLEWGDRPSDLDSWTYFGTDHSKNVKWYGKSASDPVSGIEVTLDRDDVTAIGPETTTIKNADKCVGEDACLIWFEVNNYAYWDSTTMDQAQGVVTVYHGDNTAAVYKIPECIGSATLWYTALTIDIRQGHSEVYEGFRQTPPSLVASTSTWATNNGLPGNSVYYASENSWLKLDSSRVLFAARTNDGSHRRRYVSRAVYHEISNGQDCDGCCQEVPIDLSLEGSWGTCPSGFYMSGLYRQERGRPDMYVALYCCRQKQMPEAHGSCVETEWVISNSQSMVTCPTLESGELTAMVGWYRGTSEDVLESITKVRCCAFPEMPLELAADMPGTCENPAT